MSRLTKRERVLAALNGRSVDRPPVAAWGHLIPAEVKAEDLAQASLKFFHDYDWDWLKVNPRASLFAEGWGSQFNFQEYHGVLPRFVKNPNDPIDWARLPRASVDNPVWKSHIDALKTIKKGIGGAPFVQTVFSPLSTLAYLAGRPTDHSQQGAADNHARTALDLIRREPEKTKKALEVIAHSLADLAKASVEAGADGVFFAITKLAREGVLSRQEFAEFGKPYDKIVLDAVRGAEFNLLHLCGSGVYWTEVQDYPVHAVNWASADPKNPTLTQARQGSSLALVGGLDELGVLYRGTTAEVTRAVQKALDEGGKEKFLLSPGCCVEPDIPAANLLAFRKAAGA